MFFASKGVPSQAGLLLLCVTRCLARLRNSSLCSSG